jgi:hypothetical protein
MKLRKETITVIPAKAGIQLLERFVTIPSILNDQVGAAMRNFILCGTTPIPEPLNP